MLCFSEPAYFQPSRLLHQQHIPAPSDFPSDVFGFCYHCPLPPETYIRLFPFLPFVTQSVPFQDQTKVPVSLSPHRQWSLYNWLCHGFFQTWTGLYIWPVSPRAISCIANPKSQMIKAIRFSRLSTFFRSTRYCNRDERTLCRQRCENFWSNP
jgi:hypothetical protein